MSRELERFRKVADYMYDWNLEDNFGDTALSSMCYTIICSADEGCYFLWGMASGKGKDKAAIKEAYRKEILADFLDGYDIEYSDSDYFIVIDDEDGVFEDIGLEEPEVASTAEELIDNIFGEFLIQFGVFYSNNEEYKWLFDKILQKKQEAHDYLAASN